MKANQANLERLIDDSKIPKEVFLIINKLIEEKIDSSGNVKILVKDIMYEIITRGFGYDQQTALRENWDNIGEVYRKYGWCVSVDLSPSTPEIRTSISLSLVDTVRRRSFIKAIKSVSGQNEQRA